MSNSQIVDFGTRYPESGIARVKDKDINENLIESAYGSSGVKVRNIHAVVTGDAIVKVDGIELKPERSFKDTGEYYFKHEVNVLGNITGGISSVTIEGDATFFVEFYK